jgi:hypothetical protein
VSVASREEGREDERERGLMNNGENESGEKSARKIFLFSLRRK